MIVVETTSKDSIIFKDKYADQLFTLKEKYHNLKLLHIECHGQNNLLIMKRRTQEQVVFGAMQFNHNAIREEEKTSLDKFLQP